MKNLIKDNWLYLLLSVTLMIGGALAEPLLSVLGILVGVTCVLATGMEHHTNGKFEQQMSAKEKESRNYTGQFSYSTY